MSRSLVSADQFQAGAALVALSKAADHPITYTMAGRLQLTHGWLVLSVPAALVRGAYDALHEPGANLPNMFAIPVMSPKELSELGGAGKITERGHQYQYALGAVRSHEPRDSFSKVFYITVLSPELKKLRQSYGLTPYPKGESFQLPIATRAIGVLGNNEISKLAECLAPYDEDEFDLSSFVF